MPITSVDRSYLWLQTERYTGNADRNVASLLYHVGNEGAGAYGFDFGESCRRLSEESRPVG